MHPNFVAILRRFFICISAAALFIFAALGAERVFFGEVSYLSDALTSPVKKLITFEDTNRKIFTIAIEYELGPAQQHPDLEATLEAIESRLVIKDKQVEIKVIDRKNLQNELAQGRIDITITQSDFFATLSYADALRAIATLWPNEASAPQNAFSTTVIVNAKNRNAYTFADIIKNKNPVIALNATSQSLLVFKDELRQMGFDYRLINDRLRFSPTTRIEDVIDTVAKDPEAIGVIPSCSLEDYSYPKGISPLENFRVLNRQSTDSLRCLHSGSEYPMFVIAYNPAIGAEDLWEFSNLLYSLNMPSGARWSVYDDFRSIFDMLYRLRIGPYDTTISSNVERFYLENRGTVIVVLFIAVAIMLYNLIISLEVKKRTRALKLSIKERERIARQQEETNDYITRLERTGIVGQMSSMIAHELKQPLAAVSNYTHGLLRRLQKGQIDSDKLIEILDEIDSNTQRAVEIVEHVQSYAKQHSINREVADLRTIIGSTVATFEKSRRTKIPVKVRGIRSALAEVDPWEVELALVNLLKNSADAFAEIPKDEITEDSEIVIHLADADANWLITVSDTAKLVTQETTDKFFKSMKTTKTYGLGLGLSIVSSLAERHGGRVWAQPNDPKGVVVFMELPKAAPGKKPNYKLVHKSELDNV